MTAGQGAACTWYGLLSGGSMDNDVHFLPPNFWERLGVDFFWPFDFHIRFEFGFEAGSKTD